MRDRDAVLSAGATVIIRQVSAGSVGVMIREIGAGVLAAAPEVGNRLRIELRRGRGLASSPVTHLRSLGAGQLVVKTEGRVYMLSDVEESEGPDRSEVESIVAELLDAAESSSTSGGSETEYVRLLPVAAKEERRIRVVRVGDGEEEFFGEGALLGEIELGQALRFTGQNGNVMATSAIEMLRELSPSCVEISTGNSRYQVEFLSGRLLR